MRGSPLLRAAIAFLILLCLGFPLWRLTHAVEAPRAEARGATPAPVKAIHLHLDFTALPKSFQVMHLGREVWSESAPALEMDRDLSLAYPDQGVDLQFHIEFPDNAPLAAMRAKLTDPAGDDHEKSLWGRGPIDDVITFP